MNNTEQIKEALSKATPGPWKHYASIKRVVVASDGSELVLKTIAHEVTFNDAHLIAQAPTWLAYLIDELEKAQRGHEVALSSHRHVEEELYKAQKEAEFWKTAAETQKDNNLAILNEHAAMKEALEWYADEGKYAPWINEHTEEVTGSSDAEEDNGNLARNALSSLQRPTE